MMSSWENYHFNLELFLIDCVKTDFYKLALFLNKTSQISKIIHKNSNKIFIILIFTNKIYYKEIKDKIATLKFKDDFEKTICRL